MFAPIVQLATTIHAVLAHAPSNRLASRLRAEGGLGSALAAMTAGAAYLFAAATCTMLLDRDGPGWLNVLVLLFICYAAIAVMPMLAAQVGGGERTLSVGVIMCRPGRGWSTCSSWTRSRG